MKNIGISDDTYKALKALSQREFRSMGQQIRIMMENWESAHKKAGTAMPAQAEGGSATATATATATGFIPQDPYEHALEWWDRTPKEEMGVENITRDMELLRMLYQYAEKGKGRADITEDDIALAMDYAMKNHGVAHPGNRAA